jgi:putative heme-binding domain-containing protein
MEDAAADFLCLNRTRCLLRSFPFDVMTPKRRVCPGLEPRVAGKVRRFLPPLFALLAAILAAAPALFAQADSKPNPYATSADVGEGATSFRHHCAGCHGPQGRGGRSPDLTAAELNHGDSAGALFQTVRFGVAGTEMSGTRFPDKRVWQIVAYLQSLRRRVSQANVRGDRLRGKALFDGKGGCASCHWVNGKGGRLGPELSRIGAGRSLDGLRSALVDPNEDVAPAYWQWKIVDKDGNETRGIRLHEDNFSIRLLESNERLVSIDKQSLQEIQRQRVSAMPDYGETLSAKELDDLIAYLYSLR